MGFALYVLLIALANLGLGYAMAVAVGRAKRGVHQPATHARLVTAAPSAPIAAPAAEPAPAPPSCEETETVEPEPPAQDQVAVEAALKTFRGRLARYVGDMSAINERLHHERQGDDTTAMRACVWNFREANDRYLAGQVEEVDVLATDAAGKQAEAQRRLKAAIEAQTHSVHISSTRLDEIGDTAGPEVRPKLLETSAQVARANHALRDTIHSTAGAVCGSEEHAEAESDPYIDPLTGLRSRAGILAALEALRHEGRPPAAVLCRVDQLQRINQEHGTSAGDVVLKSVARLLAPGDELPSMGRLSGSSYLRWLTGDCDESALETAEQMRQTIERTCLQWRGATLEVTLTCAVATAEPDEEVVSLLERLGETLEEARRYGRNCTFRNEAGQPLPVPPAELTLQPRVVFLQAEDDAATPAGATS